MDQIEKYRFKPFDPRTKNYFYYEKMKLQKIIRKSEVYHVGSTALKIGGKGIVDICLVLSKNEFTNVEGILEKNNWIYSVTASNEERKFFKKDYRMTQRRVHLHVSFSESQEWQMLVNLAEHMTQNQKVLKQYSDLKKKASMKAQGDGSKYQKEKQKFLDFHTQEAMKK
jgi:GrpB-like predicted nucleotidyltransferase (UPF0157 family)